MRAKLTLPMSPCPSHDGLQMAGQPFPSLFLLVALTAVGVGRITASGATEIEAFQLRPTVQVSSDGVFLDQVIASSSSLPSLRVCDAPPFGKSIVIKREQITQVCGQAGLDLSGTNWAGASAAQVSRRSRIMSEAEVLKSLTGVLQEQCVKDRGELELRLSRPWTTVPVPDEPLKLKVLDMPTAGVAPAFIVRFQVETSEGECIGPWQAALQARIWREIWIARSALKRGDSLRATEVARERRDVLGIREPIAEFDLEDSALQVADPVPAGAPLPARSVKSRPVVHRGEMVAGVLEEGAMAITLKLEALEDGAPGQVIRVRNPGSRRDLRAKVMNEQSVRILL
jgi:flagellar basal body P-ring formation protein FlgA